MRNTGAEMHTPVFLIGLHWRESSSAVIFHAEAAERASAWKLGATGELLQGPAIAIRITKIGKRLPIQYLDLTDVSTSSEKKTKVSAKLYRRIEEFWGRFMKEQP